MISSTKGAVAFALLAIAALTATPSLARGSNGFSSDEIAVMCTSAYEVCYAACKRPSDTFSSTFDQQSCEMQCDASFNACVGSYGGSNSALTVDSPRQSHPTKRVSPYLAQ